MLLAIDTSTNESGVALYNADGVLAECAWHSGRRHAEQVLPTIDLLLRHLDASPAELTAVAIATGPGSWSGLRVGMSLAKALVVAHAMPIIGVPTLDVLAYPHRAAAQKIVPFVRLGRDRYGLAEYSPTAMGVERIGPFQNLALHELLRLTAPVLICGDVDEAARTLLLEHTGDQVTFADAVQNVRRPAALAHLAWQRLQGGDVDDLVALEPIYLGGPVKETKSSA